MPNNKFAIYRDKRIGIGKWGRLDDDHRLINAAIGLTAEAGEVADLVKKWRFHGKDLDAKEVLLEAGDVLHYLDECLYQVGHTLEEAMDSNIAKLHERKKRYETFPSSANLRK